MSLKYGGGYRHSTALWLARHTDLTEREILALLKAAEDSPGQVRRSSDSTVEVVFDSSAGMWRATLL